MKAPGKTNGHRTPTTGLVKRARPEGVLYTVDALAAMFGKSVTAMYAILARAESKLGDPMYTQARLPRDRRLYRVLPASDVLALREMFPVYVKEKSTRPL